MASKFDDLKKELATLVGSGDLLYYAMADDVGKLGETAKKQLKEHKIELPNFDTGYETWYSEALRVVKQVLPDRIDDFVKQYKNEKRKEIDFLTYSISDALLGLTTRRYGEVVAEKASALPKFQVQLAILKSAQKRFDSALFDIQDVLQADIFDSELDAATSLTKNGFVRAGGAVAGVVLEKHLGHVCDQHGLKSKKSHPTIADYYQMLKEANVIDTAKWRFIQHLGDIRNLCDHGKDREPTKDEVLEMIVGVEKMVKTVF
ncbi:MAG: hypothetical protein HY661_13655 [Betaproteobacteria bacterium]|nr:hypothetical protein [Betaproteobacteria bacterium]